jgi:hypothetical protein
MKIHNYIIRYRTVLSARHLEILRAIKKIERKKRKRAFSTEILIPYMYNLLM